MTHFYVAGKKEAIQQTYLEQKKLLLSRASTDYDPNQRNARIDSVKHVGSSWSFGKEKRMPDPKIVCKGVYSPHYESVEKHIPHTTITAAHNTSSRLKVPPPARDYNASYKLVKPRTQVASLRSRPTKEPSGQPKQVDASYYPQYTQVEKQVTHSTFLSRQAGRDRAVIPTGKYVSSYTPEKPLPKHSVSAWSSISNPRSNDVGDLSRELDFLIQHTEKSWKHVDDTLSEFTEAVQ